MSTINPPDGIISGAREKKQSYKWTNGFLTRFSGIYLRWSVISFNYIRNGAGAVVGAVAADAVPVFHRRKYTHKHGLIFAIARDAVWRTLHFDGISISSRNNKNAFSLFAITLMRHTLKFDVIKKTVKQRATLWQEPNVKKTKQIRAMNFHWMQEKVEHLANYAQSEVFLNTSPKRRRLFRLQET